ncbi:MAG: permease [Thermoplasmatota archaeon]
MSTTVIVINIIALLALVAVFVKDRKKTLQALKIGLMSFVKMLPIVLIIIIGIGLLLGFVPTSTIENIAGNDSGILSVIMISLLGAVMFIPALVSFPLAASLLEGGASVTAVAAFITTLTMIGTITIPIEIRELGKKMTILRNGMSFIIAIIIAVIMGLIL